MTTKVISRKTLTIAVAIILAVAFVFALKPKPLLVDVDTVSTGMMNVTIDEEAKTRVHEAYVVSSPVTGRLLRVDVESGDQVVQGETIIAKLLPVYPQVLDSREQAQAKATVDSAQAAVEAAKAAQQQANTENDFQHLEFQRAQQQLEANVISQAAFDLAQKNKQAADAGVIKASATLAIREAELVNAQAALLSLENSDEALQHEIDIKAPVNGQILRVIQESETVISAGNPILELGDIKQDLEIVAELLSTDAVKVQPGQDVIINNWGGDEPLTGKVSRIEPYGFTKFSALGVEEQRTKVIIQFDRVPSGPHWLGHGFRVEVSVVIWQQNDALIVPSSALFRINNNWGVFVLADGKANLQQVTVDHNNGQQASISVGLASGQQVILYPSAQLTDGANVEAR